MAIKRTAAKKRVSVKHASRPSASRAGQTIPLMVYRRIAITFVIVVAIALFAVLYLSTMRAVIQITPVQSPIKTDFIAQTVQTPIDDTDIQGTVLSGTLGKTKTFIPEGGATTQVEGVTRGIVQITNTGKSAQPLVATTRFLSSEGVLFRLEDGVTVGAGETVSAEVYSDQIGATGDIAPTTFTIPGLNAAKQKIVTGQSLEAFTGGVKDVQVISQEFMDASAIALETELAEDAKSMLREEVDTPFQGESFDVKVIEKVFSVEPNTEADSFDITMNVTVAGVFFDKTALQEVAIKKLHGGLGQGKEFLNASKDGVGIVVDKYNVETGVANLLVSLDAFAVTSRTSTSLDVTRFVGMSEEQVRSSLINDGIAKKVDVQFFPFWVNTIPRLKDHVLIEIKN